jgi:predicted deacylase
VLEGEVQTRASLGLPPAVIIDGRDPRNIVVSPEDGLFEAMLEPGERVASGQPVGRLWFMDRPDRPPELLCSPSDGIVVATKAIPVTEQGDCVFVVGVPIAREQLL